MHVYMYVTDDKYSLPIYVADTVRELAEILKVTPNSIAVQMSQCKRRNTPCRFIKVDISNLED